MDQVRDLAQQVLDNNSDVCDAATDNFLDRLGGSKEDCEKASEEGDKVDSEVKDVEIDGNERLGDHRGRPGRHASTS